MFLAIIGRSCAGKKVVQDYFISKDFTRLTLDSTGEPKREGSGKTFASEAAMLDFVTRDWRSDFVTTSLKTCATLEMFLKRPFVLLLHVDAPLLERWNRHQPRVVAVPSDYLGAFLEEDDRQMYGVNQSTPQSTAPSSLGHTLSALPHLTVINSFGTLAALHQHLDSLDILNPERLRPGWDSYFMTLSELAAQRSNCMKRRVGAILVRNNRILSTGYNGTPRGLQNCNEGGCGRCNGLARSGEALDECLCLHAEENALLEAGRERVGEGATLYCNTCPCLRCSVKIIQTGVKEVVYNFAYSMDDSSAAVFKEAGVQLRQHSPAHRHTFKELVSSSPSVLIPNSR